MESGICRFFESTSRDTTCGREIGTSLTGAPPRPRQSTLTCCPRSRVHMSSKQISCPSTLKRATGWPILASTRAAKSAYVSNAPTSIASVSPATRTKMCRTVNHGVRTNDQGELRAKCDAEQEGESHGPTVRVVGRHTRHTIHPARPNARHNSTAKGKMLESERVSELVPYLSCAARRRVSAARPRCGLQRTSVRKPPMVRS